MSAVWGVDEGDTYGQNSLRILYLEGRGGLPNYEREAARLYKLAADQGIAQFQDRRTTVKRELRLDRRCDAANSNLKTCL
jgi:hypothetical protein